MSSFLGHGLAAYALFSLNQQKWPSTLRSAIWLGWLVVLASAPDIDYLVPALARQAHNGNRITHSIALSLILPLFSVGVIYLVRGLRGQRTVLSICAVLAGLSHLVLDFLVGVTPLPLLWPLSSAAFSSPIGILPSAGRIQLSNYYFYRNMLVEAGVLIPLLYLARELYLGRIHARNKTRMLLLLLVAICFMGWSVSFSRKVSNSADAPRPLDAKCPAFTADGVEVSCLTLRQARYVIVRIDLNAAQIKLLWKNPAGVPYGSLGEAHRQVGGELLAITNAGIYSESHAPEGLHIEGGQPLSSLNLNKRDGNFYWKPNGVFYIADHGAGIVESEKFDALSASGGVREATQSGPLLVIDGEVNLDLKPDSQSVHVRNGIGVKSTNEVYIVISNDEVNLHDFASVFRELQCRSALYLDGCVSQMYLPARDSYLPERRRCEKELVGMLGVMKRK